MENKIDPEFNTLVQEPQEPFQTRDGLLYRSGKLCIPKGETRSQILKGYHEMPSKGHMGLEKTFSGLSSQYFWKTLKKYLEHFMQTCPDCQMNKASSNYRINSSSGAPTEKMECNHNGIHHRPTINQKKQ